MTMPSLAAAAQRLRRKPGRPSKRPQVPPLQSPPVQQVRRLLDLDSAALYLSLSPWTIRDLIANGVLSRVRVPLPGGAELRRVLLDREDLDALVMRWKDGPEVENPKAARR